MPKEINRWAMYPRETSTFLLPESLKMEVTIKANELIETVLKPRYIQPLPGNPQFNYLVDIYGKWYHKAFYFCAEYCVVDPNPIEPSFEAKFARWQAMFLFVRLHQSSSISSNDAFIFKTQDSTKTGQDQVCWALS